ncbi:hypothetical protein GBA52_018989 [Prunus armeniaca]|nr:hypothetical protein GBA52_018989 [Prunus armeniaca]
MRHYGAVLSNRLFRMQYRISQANLRKAHSRATYLRFYREAEVVCFGGLRIFGLHGVSAPLKRLELHD